MTIAEWRSKLPRGCVYRSDGRIVRENGANIRLGWLGGYYAGDAVTVRLDCDANTVSFRKNGVEIGAPQRIAEGKKPYHFMFTTTGRGNAVTISEIN